MSGLLALLDDVAGIAKVAASSVDDILGQATKVGVKAAGAVIDDAACHSKIFTRVFRLTGSSQLFGELQRDRLKTNCCIYSQLGLSYLILHLGLLHLC